MDASAEEGLVGSWETAAQPFDGWTGERWELDADGRGRVVSAGILITAGIVEFEWAAGEPGTLAIRFEGDLWRDVAYELVAGEDGRVLLREVGDAGFCGSDGALVRAGEWLES